MKISPLQNVEPQSFNCKLWYIYQLCSCEQKLSCCRLQPKKKLVTDRHESLRRGLVEFKPQQL